MFFGWGKRSTAKAVDTTSRASRPSRSSLARNIDLTESEEAKPGFAKESTGFDTSASDAVQDGDTMMVDLVFCMDCTGSMGSYIQTAKSSIEDIVDKVAKSDKCDVRFGYVAYRDHPPQDTSFVTMCHDFMTDPQEMKAAIATFGASGGGDGPEAVTAGLKQAANYPWRKRAVRIVVLIADAPPHGIGASGDGFPNGDPNGDDPIEVANSMARQGVILYVVACEPSLSSYTNAHDVMEGLAQITEGKYLPLTAASLLPDVIIGGAGEEASLKKLEEFVESNVKKMEQDDVPREEIEKRLHKVMEGVKTNQVEITDIYGGYDRTNIEAVAKVSSLSEARKRMVPLRQPEMQMKTQEVSYASSAMPVSKMVNRCYKKM